MIRRRPAAIPLDRVDELHVPDAFETGEDDRPGRFPQIAPRRLRGATALRAAGFGDELAELVEQYGPDEVPLPDDARAVYDAAASYADPGRIDS